MQEAENRAGMTLLLPCQAPGEDRPKKPKKRRHMSDDAAAVLSVPWSISHFPGFEYLLSRNRNFFILFFWRGFAFFWANDFGLRWTLALGFPGS